MQAAILAIGEEIFIEQFMNSQSFDSSFGWWFSSILLLFECALTPMMTKKSDIVSGDCIHYSYRWIQRIILAEM